jgi:hypothetical protein
MDLILSDANSSLVQNQEEQKQLHYLFKVINTKAKQDVELGSLLHYSVLAYTL